MPAPQPLTLPHLKHEKMEVIAPALPTSELLWGLNQIKYTEVLEKLEDLYKYKMVGVTDTAVVAYG